MIGWSKNLAQDFNLSDPFSYSKSKNEIEKIVSGNALFPSMKPFASRYGGHQFGHWAGQLGDGRAITLCEIKSNTTKYEFQLKGSGKTPYSRQGDGRAVLRSSLREFICSEFMDALGVPTTRSLSLVLTGDQVMRDLLYDGNPKLEPGAIASRLSPSFIRFGNFEILAAQNEINNLKILTDYVIENFYPECFSSNEKQKYILFLESVVRKTAYLIAKWMSFGFVHGVMNTDNMSILGLTIDYGPYGWLEEFDSNFTPNTTDYGQRRYSYNNQPEIGLWNLNALAQALYPLIQDKDLIISTLEVYQGEFQKEFKSNFEKKLGIDFNLNLVNRLFELMNQSKIDFTRFFRKICYPQKINTTQEIYEFLSDLSYLKEIPQNHLDQWLEWWLEYNKLLKIEKINEMKKTNPSIIFRNYMAFEMTDRIQKSTMLNIQDELQELLQPFKERDLKTDSLTFIRPDWAMNKPGCSFLSCSS